MGTSGNDKVDISDDDADARRPGAGWYQVIPLLIRSLITGTVCLSKANRKLPQWFPEHRHIYRLFTMMRGS